MNENPTLDTVSTRTTLKMGTVKLPSWWDENITESWNTVKAAVIADWHKVVDGNHKLEAAVDEEVLAFGHGARRAYARFEVWSDDLDKTLRDDWNKLGHEGERAWDKVRDAVRHSWQRATGSAPSTDGKTPIADAKPPAADARTTS